MKWEFFSNPARLQRRAGEELLEDELKHLKIPPEQLAAESLKGIVVEDRGPVVILDEDLPGM